MPSYTYANQEPHQGFSGGIDQDSPRTALQPDVYEDATNMVLFGTNSGNVIQSTRIDAKLDPDITWPTGDVVWFHPFTYNTYNTDTGVWDANTHLIILRTSGAYYRYDSGAPGTCTLVRRLDKTIPVYLTNSMVYDAWIVVLNGRDAPYKYGQHFLWDGINLERPYMFPVGSKPISPVDLDVTGETTAHGAGGSYVADASAPGGGARVGTHCLKVAAGTTTTITFDVTRNLEEGPAPYGGTDFAGTDFVQFHYLKSGVTATTGDITIKFKEAGGDYFQFVLDDAEQTGDNQWHTTGSYLDIASATTSGTPDWTLIKSVDIINNDGTYDLYFDDLYLLYANAPPAASVGAAHKDRIVLGGVPTTGALNEPAWSTIFYSPANKPDEFPAVNTQYIIGGATSLALTNRITAMHEYQDTVIIGTGNSIHTWTIGESGLPSRTLVTAELGIDSPRAVVETPSGALMFIWQRGVYLLKQTGRQMISEKIRTIIDKLWLPESWWSLICRDEATKTYRLWWREYDAELDASTPAVTNQGVIYDYIRAQADGKAVWPSRATLMADYACEAYIDGERRLLYSRFDDGDIWVLGYTDDGPHVSQITLPWKAQDPKDYIAKWVAAQVSYRSTSNVRVFGRWADGPHMFDSAQWEELDGLAPNPDTPAQGRVLIGRPQRWFQLRFQSSTTGFELYPPINYMVAPTKREP